MRNNKLSEIPSRLVSYYVSWEVFIMNTAFQWCYEGYCVRTQGSDSHRLKVCDVACM